MDIFYTLIKFFTAGFIIVGVTLIVQHIDPKYGGILAAAPITTTIAFLFTYFESGSEVVQDLVLGSFFFAIPSVLFLLTLYLLMERFSPLIGIIGAGIIWILGVVIMQRIVFSS